MPTPFPFRLLTPAGPLFSGEAECVVAPGALGELGIQARHIPMLSAVRPGLIHVRQSNRTWWFLVGDCLLRTDGRECLVLADLAEAVPDTASGLERMRQLGWDPNDLRRLTAPEE